MQYSHALAAVCNLPSAILISRTHDLASTIEIVINRDTSVTRS